MLDLNRQLLNAFEKKEALIIIGETGTGKTGIVKNFINSNKLECCYFQCSTFLPLGKINPFGFKTEEFFDFDPKEFDLLFFDMIDCCEEEVRTFLLSKVDEYKKKGIFVVATAWPTIHYGRDPLSKERLSEHFDCLLMI